MASSSFFNTFISLDIRVFSQEFKMIASLCGLPASTVKLSRPPRNACESAADNLTSISRYRAPECMCVSACVYVCVMRVCTCEDALVALSVSVSRLCKHVRV
jgi:hypothetical protein